MGIGGIRMREHFKHTFIECIVWGRGGLCAREAQSEDELQSVLPQGSGDGCSSAGECLPSTCEALGSILGTTTKNNSKEITMTTLVKILSICLVRHI